MSAMSLHPSGIQFGDFVLSDESINAFLINSAIYPAGYCKDTFFART